MKFKSWDAAYIRMRLILEVLRYIILVSGCMQPITVITAQNRPLCEKQDRCSLFSVLCYFRYFVRE